MLYQPQGGIWIRIRHRFGPRMTEWMLAAITALWGAVLLLPAETFTGQAFELFRAARISENLMGTVMLFLGILRIAGLVVNGARREVTPWIRMVSAGCGFMIFVGISTAFALSGSVSTWLAVYPVFAGIELVNIYRAAHDAGEGNAVP
ncbi:hypothetical protein [Devosia sp. Naph2]|uniref:hypothetical protein n=1 Tax=Devosia polycyclovorans TaxID=3345148 RepID=UPI0035D0DA72